jgi:hypothetical protein
VLVSLKHYVLFIGNKSILSGKVTGTDGISLKQLTGL